MDRKALYDRERSRCLREREMRFRKENQEKLSLLMENIGACRRLVDIGCGWGQLLSVAQDSVPEVWGVDESPDRISDVRRNCPKARAVICRADSLGLSDEHFDLAVTSQVLHEVRLFGQQGELRAVLAEIRRVLVKGGRYLLLDHLDAGNGDVVVELTQNAMRRLVEFEGKFRFRRANHEAISGHTVKITKRSLQDYVTKIWSLNSAMESIEMEETHNVFQEKETTRLIQSSGFSVCKWIAFSDIRQDLERVGGALTAGEPWYRKFLLVAVKR